MRCSGQVDMKWCKIKVISEQKVRFCSKQWEASIVPHLEELDLVYKTSCFFCHGITQHLVCSKAKNRLGTNTPAYLYLLRANHT